MPMCNWLLDFLSGKPQSVNNISSSISLSIGSPQGRVALLFTLLTQDCCAASASNYIIKYADDTTVVGLIRNDSDLPYREEVKRLVGWCSDNDLMLNDEKTKEMITDFRRKSIQDIALKRCLSRACDIIGDSAHPHHGPFSLLPSGKRLCSIIYCKFVLHYN